MTGSSLLPRRFKEVKEAYEALIDDQKRQIYDQFGEAGLKRGPGGFGGPAGATEVDIGTIFDSFFGGETCLLLLMI